ncbi:hypothetical protein J4E06_06125 [Muricauda sp. NFXS6]|uniref:hypothetical protein n=1 Tax=Allomuricauda sp. NFXS6 TaxID=2819094 RepID=UPI0032DE8AD4
MFVCFLGAQHNKRSGFGQGFWEEIGRLRDVAKPLAVPTAGKVFKEVETLFVSKTRLALTGSIRALGIPSDPGPCERTES